MTFTSGANNNPVFYSTFAYSGMTISGTGIPINSYIGAVSLTNGGTIMSIAIVDINGNPVNLTSSLTGVAWITFVIPTTVTQNIVNNVFYNLSQNAIYVSTTQNVLNIKNNIFYNASTQPVNSINYSTSSSTAIQYNVFYNQGTSIGFIVDGTNSTINPNLTSTYKLIQGSPFINSGIFVGYHPDATGRPFNNPPSIGAYEDYSVYVDQYTE